MVRSFVLGELSWLVIRCWPYEVVCVAAACSRFALLIRYQDTSSLRIKLQKASPTAQSKAEAKRNISGLPK